MNIIHKLIRRCVNRYVAEEKKLNTLPNGGVIGENICIQTPCIISHPELVEIGEGTTILSGSRIQAYPELTGRSDYKLTVGKNCYLGYRLCVLIGASIAIGNNVLMASDITLASENHGMDPESEIPYMDQQLLVKPISIGDNCWIGDKVIITAGVSIGRNCIIGAGSVVTKDIPDLCMAAGNPARIIKRYDMEIHQWVRIKE